MATGKKNAGREADLEAAIEKIRKEIWKPGQILSKLHRAIALILQDLKSEGGFRDAKTYGLDGFIVQYGKCPGG